MMMMIIIIMMVWRSGDRICAHECVVVESKVIEKLSESSLDFFFVHFLLLRCLYFCNGNFGFLVTRACLNWKRTEHAMNYSFSPCFFFLCCNCKCMPKIARTVLFGGLRHSSMWIFQISFHIVFLVLLLRRKLNITYSNFAVCVQSNFIVFIWNNYKKITFLEYIYEYSDILINRLSIWTWEFRVVKERQLIKMFMLRYSFVLWYPI